MIDFGLQSVTKILKIILESAMRLQSAITSLDYKLQLDYKAVRYTIVHTSSLRQLWKSCSTLVIMVVIMSSLESLGMLLFGLIFNNYIGYLLMKHL